jgi:hypothetical protein
VTDRREGGREGNEGGKGGRDKIEEGREIGTNWLFGSS